MIFFYLSIVLPDFLFYFTYKFYQFIIAYFNRSLNLIKIVNNYQNHLPHNQVHHPLPLLSIHFICNFIPFIVHKILINFELTIINLHDLYYFNFKKKLKKIFKKK